MMRSWNTIMVSGGAGFIGGNFIRHILGKKEFAGRVINVDALSHTGNPLSLRDVEDAHGTKRYVFERADIRDRSAMDRILNNYGVECIVHFAAESRIDSSAFTSSDFITTNINGTLTLLQAARAWWEGRREGLFHHVSTAGVFGSTHGLASEDSPYNPSAPYTASKAASDHLVRAWASTYGTPVTVSIASRNYGPYHFPEELIPLIITNALSGKALPVFGRKDDTRDWLYVTDHAEAIWRIITRGRVGESYNISGENALKNTELVQHISKVLARATNRQESDFSSLITFVEDGAESPLRSTLGCDKIKKELSWKQAFNLDQGLEATVRWYLENQAWVEEIRSGEYLRWIEKNFGKRKERVGR